MHSLKIALKIIIGFFFSINVIMVFLTLSLFGIQARDTARLVVTEATGLQRDMVVFQAELQPLIIHNLFWVCLASFGFLLIFLFFIDHSFKPFVGPGTLSLMITFFAAAFVILYQDSIMSYAGPLADLYIKTAFDRFWQAVIGMIVFGILLLVLSYRGDSLLRKKEPAN